MAIGPKFCFRSEVLVDLDRRVAARIRSLLQNAVQQKRTTPIKSVETPKSMIIQAPKSDSPLSSPPRSEHQKHLPSKLSKEDLMPIAISQGPKTESTEEPKPVEAVVRTVPVLAPASAPTLPPAVAPVSLDKIESHITAKAATTDSMTVRYMTFIASVTNR